MLPRRVAFATNVSNSSGAGHFRRLFEISRVIPDSSEVCFFGSLDIPWIKEMSEDRFVRLNSLADLTREDIVVLDSYEESFCSQVVREASGSYIIQIADRYTPLLPKVPIILMDLPFAYPVSSIGSKVIAHGLEYLPIRRIAKQAFKFREQASRVIVTTGGLVNESIFAQLVEELSKSEYREVRFEFIGKPKYFKAHPQNLRFHNFGKAFDSIVEDCETAISASGTTLWDLLANQILVGLAVTAKNQRANFEYAIEKGQALGIFHPDTLELDVDALQSLLFDSNTRHSIHKKISGKYDFGGAERVRELIFKEFRKVNGDVLLD
jgi:spore coat polysaccharide biosynthesis predicted glycosyltransferase SpsG